MKMLSRKTKKSSSKKINFKVTSLWFRIFLYILFIAAVCGSVYFLYIYLYQAIAQTREVEELQTIVAPASVNAERFERTLLEYEQKKAGTSPAQLNRNPFSGTIITTPSDETPTTTPENKIDE